MKYLDPKYKQKYSPRSESEKVHTKSIESSVNDAISRKREVKQELGGTIDYRSIMKYLDEKYKRKQLPRGNSEKVHAKTIERSVNDAVSKRIYDIGTRANSPKVHTKSIEASVIDAVSKEKLASGDAGLGKGKRKT